MKAQSAKTVASEWKWKKIYLTLRLRLGWGFHLRLYLESRQKLVHEIFCGGQLIATCQSLCTDQPWSRQGCLRHILTNANGLDCNRLICIGCSGRLRPVSIVVKTGIIRCEVGQPTSWELIQHLQRLSGQWYRRQVYVHWRRSLQVLLKTSNFLSICTDKIQQKHTRISEIISNNNP